MTTLADVLTVLLVLSGALFFLAGAVGLARFPDALSRLHALSKADNLGLGLIAAGLLLQAPDLRTAAKLAAIWLLAQLSAAAVSQLIAQAVMRREPPPDIHR